MPCFTARHELDQSQPLRATDVTCSACVACAACARVCCSRSVRRAARRACPSGCECGRERAVRCSGCPRGSSPRSNVQPATWYARQSTRTGACSAKGAGGMERDCLASWGLVAAMACALIACGASGQTLCRPDPITGSQQCQIASKSPVDAALTTGVAAGVYVATGCTVNGCPLPDRCNPKTKRCETIYCDESQTCPAGYSCAMDVHLCR
jgi:hypothetical protein